MKIGIGLPNQVRNVRPEGLPTWARLAEEAGFSTLGTVGRIAYPGVMDTVVLAAAAGATRTIGLLSNVLLAPVWPAVMLAKEAAGIDGVSGGRLTLGIGLGGRPDDFVVDGLGPRGTGKRLDESIEVFEKIWRGDKVPGSDNPAVPEGSRQVPLLVGGTVQASYDRAARSGEGYIAGSVPPSVVAPSFEAVRASWTAAGRPGSPRLVAIAYYAVADPDAGRANVYDYYRSAGADVAAFITGAASGGADAIRATLAAFEEIGADELIFNPTLDDSDEIARLAEIVL